MSQKQSHIVSTNLFLKDKSRPSTARNFADDDRGAFNSWDRPAAQYPVPTCISGYQPSPMTTTTITTKHYLTSPEQVQNSQSHHNHNQQSLQHQKPEFVLLQQQQYQKLVEKHNRQQQEMLKQREQQQQNLQQHHALLHQQQQEQRKKHEEQLRKQKEYLKQLQHGGVRLTGVYPPEYFQRDEDDPSPDDDDDDDVDYYLPPPAQFSTKTTRISAIPPPEDFQAPVSGTPYSTPLKEGKPTGILKSDNANLKLFVTPATFVNNAKKQAGVVVDSPTTEASQRSTTGSVEHKMNGKATASTTVGRNIQSDDLMSKSGNVGKLEKNSTPSDENSRSERRRAEETAPIDTKKVIGDSRGMSEKSKQPVMDRMQCVDDDAKSILKKNSTSPGASSSPADVDRLDMKKASPVTVKEGPERFRTPTSPSTDLGTDRVSVPPVLIRRQVDRSSLTDKTKSDIEKVNHDYKPETSHPQEPKSINKNTEKTATNKTIFSHEASKAKEETIKAKSKNHSPAVVVTESNTVPAKPIEVKMGPKETSFIRTGSIKFKVDSTPRKSPSPAPFSLPTPELKVQYVSKPPRSPTGLNPAETYPVPDSPVEKSGDKSFFASMSSPWNVNKTVSTTSPMPDGKQMREGDEEKSATDAKLSNTQKFLNFLSVKKSPIMSFKFSKNKSTDRTKIQNRKARKKSLDLLSSDAKKPLQHHSTPPLRPRGLSDNDPDKKEKQSSSAVSAHQLNTLSSPGDRLSKLSEESRPSNDRKPSVELLAVEVDAEGVPTKHMVVTPSSSSKLISAGEDSRAGSPTFKHSRQNSNGSTVFSGDLSTSFGTPEKTTPSRQHFVIVAIDFGTTYSGYAFSFVRDPESLHIMRRWEGGDPGLVNQKTLTTLLLDPEGNFHSFGFNARDSYHDLDPEEARSWFYFEKFKMALHHNAELNKHTTIKANNGKPYPAFSVFSHSLKFFKDHALQELTDQSETTILNEDIRWVITVPAIWKAPAKQFMRRAAYQAGIASADNPGQLLIALEPEAASIYVRKLRIYQLVSDATPSSATLSTSTCSADGLRGAKGHGQKKDGTPLKGETQKYKTLPTTPTIANHHLVTSPTSTIGQEVDIDGTRYMVVDCGGGTVDITVHEMESNGGSLRELHKATGGPYGSIGIDYEFEKLIVSIFGPEFIDSFKLKRPSGWIDLMTSFESRKRSAHPGKENPLNVALPFSLIEFYKKSKGNSVESAIKKFGNKGVSWSSQGMLRLTPAIMRSLFQPTVDKIKQSIGDVLNHPNARGIKYLFLVGGFAESGILQSEIRAEFGQLLRIIIPQDVGTTILKGAVCFGLDPTVVSVRRCRMTYGVGVLNRFVDGVHPPSKLVVKEGVRWCMDVLDKFVLADQPVALGDTVVRSYAPARAGQKSSVIHIYCSESSDSMFVTDVGVKKCGSLCLDVSESQYRQQSSSGIPLVMSRRAREIQAKMIFGDTEIKVSAVDVATGKCVRSTIDFLGR